MHAIYGNIYHQYTPNVSTWILWVMNVYDGKSQPKMDDGM